jgi:hypothetical protein
MSASTESFVQDLVTRFPSIRPIYDEHLDDNFGELLPHPFCGDLTRWIVNLYSGNSGIEDADKQLRAILDFLELSYLEGDDDIKELISVSILENMPSTGEDNVGIRDLLGPMLADEYSRVNW